MLKLFRYIVLLILLLSGALEALAQIAMPEKVCVGTEGRYWVVGTAGSTYTWKLNGVMQNSTLNEINLNWLSTGVFTLEVQEHQNLCSGEVQMGQVFVYEQPVAFAGNQASMCGNSTVSLSGATASNYSTLFWTSSGDGTFNNQTILNPVYTPGPNDYLSGSITLTLTAEGLGKSGSCIAAISNINLTLNPLPILVITNPAPVCYPTTIDLTDPTLYLGSDSDLLYEYFTDAEASLPIPDPKIITVGKTYYIKATNLITNCYTIKPVLVTINPQPVMVITNPEAVCQPGKVDLTLTAVTVGSEAGLAYEYLVDTLTNLPIPDPKAVTVSGIYFIRATNSITSCTKIKPVTVVINPQPILVITNPAAECSPNTIDLSSPTILTGSTIPASSVFGYYTNATGTLPVANAKAIAVSGTYYIKAIAPGGCSSTVVPVVVTIHLQPKLVITNPAPVCEPDVVNLSLPMVTNGSDLGLDYEYYADADATNPLADYKVISVSGTYYIKAINSANSCTLIKSVEVVVNKLLTPEFAPVGEFCVNENTPSLAKISDNGISGTWNPATISSANPGVITYTFTPSPAVCARTISIDVKVNKPAIPVFNPIGPLCQNNPAPGLPPVSNNGFTGTWNPATISTLTPGPFSFKFTPFTGLCAKDTTIVIVVEPEVITVFDPIGPLCPNSEPPLLPAADKNGLTGTWSPATISTSSSGVIDYFFTPDGVTCKNIKPLKIQVTEPIVLTETHQNIGYSIDPIGSIDLTVSGGFGTFTYLWSNGATTEDLSALDKGTYTVVVTDGNNCTARLDVTLTRIELMTMAAVGNDACPGFNGSIDFTFTNVPDGVYDILYSGGKFQNVPVREGEATVSVPVGSYNNLVIVINGNSSVNDIDILIKPLLALSLTANPVRSDCNNIMGSIEFKFTNVPQGFYDITYDGGTFTGVQVISSNPTKVPAIAQTYTNLMLTMATGCRTNTDNVTLDPPLGVTPLVAPPIQPTCSIPTGTIVVTYPSGPNFEYSKDGGTSYQNSETFADLLQSATYQIKTRDKVTGCESEITPVSIYSDPGYPDFATVSVTKPSCDVPTGSFTITNVAFGTGYDYSTDSIKYQDSKTFTDLVPNQTYQLRVRLKSTGCESKTSVYIDPIPALPGAPTASITSQPDCKTITTGTIVVSDPPFNSGYVYSKDGGNTYQDSAIFRNLLPGTYQVRVRSKIASSPLCGSNILELTISNPTQPAKPIAVATQPSCTDVTGTITISSPVGADLSYSIDGKTYTNTSGIFTGLIAGNYTVTVKNSGECISVPSVITLNTQPQKPVAPIADVIQPDCTIPTRTIRVSSDPNGLNFSIDGVDYTNNTGIFRGLTSGDYFVTARNLAGCISLPSVRLTVKIPTLIPDAPIASVKQPDCKISGGIITVSLATAGLHFSIDGVDFTNTSGIFNGLAPNVYQINARNADGCTSAASEKLTVDPQPEIPDAPTVSVTQPDCTISTGTITVTSATTELLFSIDGINYTKTTIFSDLSPKDYFVTAKNSVGCISIPFKSIINAQQLTPAAPIANPISAECEKYPVQKIYARSGIAALPVGITLNWYDDQGIQVTDPFLNEVGTATYFAESTNGSCVSSGRTAVTLTIIPAPAILLSQNPAPKCAASPMPEMDARTFISDVPGVTITWWDAATGGNKVANPTWSTIGTKTFYAEALNGQCTSPTRTGITLTINSLPDAPKAIVTVNPSCNFPNGTVLVTSPKEGTGFEYNIDGGEFQSSTSFALLKWGEHFVRVKQTNTGCVNETATRVFINAVPPPPILIVAAIENCICKGGSGSISFTVTNATDGIYTINYDGGVFETVSFTGGKTKVIAPAGTYNNLTIGANGCTSEAIATVTVNEPSLIAINESVLEIDLKSGRKGAIDLNVSGGVKNYSFLWSNGATTEDIKDLIDGSYSVIVTDNNGCKQQKQITIPIPNFSPVANSDAFTVGCDIITGILVANDTDPEGDPFFLDQRPIEKPLHGNLILSADGTFEYQPDLSFSGTDYFSYAIYDAKHYMGDTAKVVLTIIADFDCDGVPDVGDIDADDDGILNTDEGGQAADNDGDGIPNYLDIDSDNDGIVDNIEAQSSSNYIRPLGIDTNGDGLDDAYDPAQKGKIIDSVDTDGDKIPDYLDFDSDNDLVSDDIEGNDFSADGIADRIKIGKDSDNDGLDDAYDTVNRYTTSGNMTGSNAPLQDFDGDGKPDWRDDNDDDDSYLTRFEDLNADGNFSNDDTDKDGHPEYLDYGRDCDLFIPDIFTPNNDNIHDYFVIYCIDHFPDAKIYIFDQSGNKIFEREHYGNLEYWGSVSQAWWNGRNMYSGNTNSNFVPVGTYYYVLILGNGEVKKSYVFVSY